MKLVEFFRVTPMRLETTNDSYTYFFVLILKNENGHHKI